MIFQRINQYTDFVEETRARRILVECLGASGDHLVNGEFWFVKINKEAVGVIGFYNKWLLRYFAFAITSEYNGELGHKAFSAFLNLHSSSRFVAKTVDHGHFCLDNYAPKLNHMAKFRLGDIVVYVNGGKGYFSMVFLLERLFFVTRRLLSRI